MDGYMSDIWSRLKRTYIKRSVDEMILADTIEMMNSEDFKERFRAEYFQLKIRYQKLHDMVVKYEAGTLPFTPNCPLELLKHQKSLMEQYLYDLELRAQIEKICLS